MSFRHVLLVLLAGGLILSMGCSKKVRDVETVVNSEERRTQESAEPGIECWIAEDGRVHVRAFEVVTRQEQVRKDVTEITHYDNESDFFVFDLVEFALDVGTGIPATLLGVESERRELKRELTSSSSEEGHVTEWENEGEPVTEERPLARAVVLLEDSGNHLSLADTRLVTDADGRASTTATFLGAGAFSDAEEGPLSILSSGSVPGQWRRVASGSIRARLELQGISASASYALAIAPAGDRMADKPRPQEGPVLTSNPGERSGTPGTPQNPDVADPRQTEQPPSSPPAVAEETGPADDVIFRRSQ